MTVKFVTYSWTSDNFQYRVSLIRPWAIGFHKYVINRSLFKIIFIARTPVIHQFHVLQIGVFFFGAVLSRYSLTNWWRIG